MKDYVVSHIRAQENKRAKRQALIQLLLTIAIFALLAMIITSCAGSTDLTSNEPANSEITELSPDL